MLLFTQLHIKTFIFNFSFCSRPRLVLFSNDVSCVIYKTSSEVNICKDTQLKDKTVSGTQLARMIYYLHSRYDLNIMKTPSEIVLRRKTIFETNKDQSTRKLSGNRTMNFISITLFVLGALLVNQAYCISHNVQLGICGNGTISRNDPSLLLARNIHKPNNRYFSFMRKTEYTVRLPEVIYFATFPTLN